MQLADGTGFGFRPDHLKPTAFNAQAVTKYSAELLELIMDCVEYLPTARPTLDELRRRVRLGIGNNGEGLRNAAQDSGEYHSNFGIDASSDPN